MQIPLTHLSWMFPILGLYPAIILIAPWSSWQILSVFWFQSFVSFSSLPLTSSLAINQKTPTLICIIHMKAPCSRELSDFSFCHSLAQTYYDNFFNRCKSVVRGPKCWSQHVFLYIFPLVLVRVHQKLKLAQQHCLHQPKFVCSYKRKPDPSTGITWSCFGLKSNPHLFSWTAESASLTYDSPFFGVELKMSQY